MANPVTVYYAALADLYVHSAKGQARREFRNGMHTYPNECDFYRGEVAAREAGTPLLRDFAAIYDHRDTYGQLSIALGQPAAYPRFEYLSENLFRTAFPVTTYTHFLAAYAAILTDYGRHQRAFEILEEAHDQDNPWVLAAYGLLYRNTARWDSLLEVAARLNSSYGVNPIDGKVEVRNGKKLRNRQLRGLSVLLAGEAYAHLSKDDLAVKSLNMILELDQPYLVSYAYVLLAYINRHRGEHDAAYECLNNAKSYAPTVETDRLEEDPTELLAATTAEKIAQRTDPWDPDTEPLQQFPDGITDQQKELIVQANEELEAMIGMFEVKDTVTTMRREIEYNAARSQRGFPVAAISRHLILSGPAGTGKTSVARIIAKYYAGYGIVEHPDVVVATRSDLIGSDEGATAKMTQDVFDRALGGVLFIDEAPDMIQDRDGQPDHRGQEAISILLQNMENNRQKTIVIFAGYEGGMQRLLNTNDGLRSRFPNWVMFESYSPSEIADIADSLALGRNNILDNQAKDAIKSITSSIQATDYAGMKLIDKLGNGRFARNIIESAETNRVKRLAGVNFDTVDNTAMLTLTVADVEKAARDLIRSAL